MEKHNKGHVNQVTKDKWHWKQIPFIECDKGGSLSLYLTSPECIFFFFWLSLKEHVRTILTELHCTKYLKTIKVFMETKENVWLQQRGAWDVLNGRNMAFFCFYKIADTEKNIRYKWRKSK